MALSDSEVEPMDEEDFRDSLWRVGEIFRLNPGEQRRARRSACIKIIFGWDSNTAQNAAAGGEDQDNPPALISSEELYRRQERAQRGPSLEATIQLLEYNAALQAFWILAELNSSRGFLIKFGPWKPAPRRADEKDCWRHDPRLVRESHPKLYSRTRWYQEYCWDEPSQQHLCHGFWAPRDFVGLSEINGGQGFTKMIKGLWRPGRRNVFCSKHALPDVPPSTGFQSLERMLRLTFRQAFFRDSEGLTHGQNRWVLSFNIEPEEQWQEVDSRGLLRKGQWTRGGDD
ncbi:uncharacterized protein LOC122503627 isoform X2 [Leptopilina heterotoma]|nr:uncharacterized protein LOC122503627 isoform X2 [Leptopilina heterotoma]